MTADYPRFSWWQQLIPACCMFLQQSFSHFPAEHDDAVFSLAQSLQHDAPLSALMHDLASLPAQQGLPSLAAQHEAPS